MACDTTIAVTQTSQGVSRAEERMGRLSRTRNMIMFKYILIASFHASNSSTVYIFASFWGSLPHLVVAVSRVALCHAALSTHRYRIVVAPSSHRCCVVGRAATITVAVAAPPLSNCHRRRLSCRIVSRCTSTHRNSIVVASSSHHHYRCRTAIVKSSPCNLSCSCTVEALSSSVFCAASVLRLCCVVEFTLGY